jgi:hypothetical protein
VIDGTTSDPGHPGRAGADVHDPARALSSHGREHRLGHGHDADHVEVEDPGELVQVELVEGPVQADPGVVDQPVDPAMPVEDRPGEVADGRGVGDVRRHGQRSAEFLAQGLDAVGPAGRQHRMPARLVQQPRGGGADTRGSARDNDNAAGQVHSVHPGILAHQLALR